MSNPEEISVVFTTGSEISVVQESVEQANGVNVASSKRRSSVYAHFKEGKEKFECNYCKANVTKEKKGGTGNLLKHLVRHPSVHVETCKSKQDSKRSSIIESFKKAEENFSTRTLERLVVDHIIMSNQPFSLVEEESFLKLLMYGRTKAPEIPCANVIRDQIMKLYDVERSKLVDKLKKVPGKISIVADGWRSSNMHSFEGILGTWITTDWEYEHVVLDFDIVPGSHTGKALANALYSVLTNLGIEEKLLAVTTDNAGNMCTMTEELSIIAASHGLQFDHTEFHIRCLAHILNLSCQEALKVLKNAAPSQCASVEICVNDEPEIDVDIRSPHTNLSVYSRIKEVIKIVRKSDPVREHLRTFCNSFKVDYVELNLDMPVRWNSTYKMLQLVLRLKQPLDAVMRNTAKLSNFVLSELEWNLLKEMADFLKPFSDMTNMISVQNIPTLSLTALIYRKLYRHIEAYNTMPDVHDDIRDAAQRAKTKLDDYYPKSDSLVYVIGLVLDPRCKIHWYTSVGFSPAFSRQMKKIVMEHWEKFYKPRDATGSGGADTNSDDLYEEDMKRARFDNKDDLKRYLSEPPVRSSTLSNGALGWWKDHEASYPHLAIMARDFLACSGTGVPIESTFSMGTDVVTNKRHRLAKATVRALMCLKSWFKFNSREELRGAIAEETVKRMGGGDDDDPVLF